MASETRFSPEEVTVIFVLGGPGAGKGTQCAKLVEHKDFIHLSAGDLLRAEQTREGSKAGELIKEYIREGLIVPHEVTIALLRNAMDDAMDTLRASATAGGKVHGRFLIDGFPRKMDQAVAFEDMVCPAKLVLLYECPEAELERRLLDRGKASGRADDNIESIKKRFKTFFETSMPVVREFEAMGKVAKVDATASPEEVFAKTVEILQAKFGPGFA